MGSVVGFELMRLSVPRRRVFALAAILGATLLAPSAPAHAQSGPGAVDQYVEDVPTGGGASHPTTGTPSSTPASGVVQQQIDAQGGSDAPLLTQVASSSTYGAPQKRSGGGSSAERMERGNELPEAAGSGEESSGVVSSAVTAVEGGDSRRLLGLLLALLAVTVATVVAVGIRQRRSNRA